MNKIAWLFCFLVSQNATAVIDSKLEKISFGEVDLINKGSEYYNNFNYESALLYYQKALRINSDRSTTYVYLAGTYRNLKKYKEAADITEKGIKKFPRNLDLYLNLGYVYSDQGKYQKAFDILKQADQLEKSIKYFNFKSHLLGKLNQFENAFNESIKALEIQNSNYIAFSNALFFAEKMKNCKSSIYVYEKYYKFQRKNNVTEEDYKKCLQKK